MSGSSVRVPDVRQMPIKEAAGHRTYLSGAAPIALTLADNSMKGPRPALHSFNCHLAAAISDIGKSSSIVGGKEPSAARVSVLGIIGTGNDKLHSRYPGQSQALTTQWMLSMLAGGIDLDVSAETLELLQQSVGPISVDSQASLVQLGMTVSMGRHHRRLRNGAGSQLLGQLRQRQFVLTHLGLGDSDTPSVGSEPGPSPFQAGQGSLSTSRDFHQTGAAAVNACMVVVSGVADVDADADPRRGIS